MEANGLAGGEVFQDGSDTRAARLGRGPAVGRRQDPAGGEPEVIRGNLEALQEIVGCAEAGFCGPRELVEDELLHPADGSTALPRVRAGAEVGERREQRFHLRGSVGSRFALAGESSRGRPSMSHDPHVVVAHPVQSDDV